MVVAVLLIAGDHVPDIPLLLVVGKGGMLSPEQKGPTGLNVGVVSALTVIVIVVEIAHSPTLGLKIYVVVAILLIVGDHVPLNPSIEVVGSVSGLPAQIGSIGLNVGVTGGPTLTVIDVGTAQVGVVADVGVNV